jgi:GNAT superfamily N-acetyltransferase
MLDIRELNLEDERDFESMVVHVEKLFTELFGASALPSLHDLAELRAQLRGGATKHWAFLAWDSDAEPIGFVTLAESFAIFSHGHYGIINELWVRSDARSQGVGRELIEHCKSFGRRRNWPRIDVSAPVSAAWDRSFNFYVQRGFVQTGRKLKLLLKGE